MNRLVIVGPTASGKTNLSIKAALHFDGEIICADSRTIYKGMDIGTAKPTKKDRSDVQHHCLDIVYPDNEFTVADFVQHARLAEASIKAKHKLPIIVGGSGLFVDAYIYEYSFVKPNPDARQKYESLSVDELQQEILNKNLNMPSNSLNKRHLISELEREGSSGSRKLSPPRTTTIIGLNPPKEILHKNIQERAQKMVLEQNIKDEARLLLSRYDTKLNAFNGGIYKYLPDYFSGDINDSALIEAVIKSDLKLAKKQLTWFKRNNDIKWFEDTNSAWQWLQTQTLDRI